MLLRVVATISITIRLTPRVAEKLEKEARKMGLGLEEYLLELALRDLDPSERAVEYIDAAEELLREAREELEKGNVRQAAEKLWGASALAVKAYAEWKDSRRLVSHGELWEYSKKLIEELGDWVYDSWMAANGMHTCFYEGWCTEKHVEEAVKRIEKLVSEIKKRIES